MTFFLFPQTDEKDSTVVEARVRNARIKELQAAMQHAIAYALGENAGARRFFERAQRFDLEKMPSAAEAIRRQGVLAHLSYCRQLAIAAKAARDMIRLACPDWRPDAEVAGSGLGQDELDTLCSVVEVTKWNE